MFFCGGLLLHTECRLAVEKAVADHVSGEGPLDVADIGSTDINGTLRPVFPGPRFRYVGLDLLAGRNVDEVVKPDSFGRQRFDVVVSANVIEHVENPFRHAEACFDATRLGGLVIIVTPTIIHVHRHPIDCWRILEDGMRCLLQGRRADVVEVRAIGGQHNDTLGVFLVRGGAE